MEMVFDEMKIGCGKYRKTNPMQLSKLYIKFNFP